MREREDASLHPSVYRILIIDCYSVGAVCRRIVWSRGISSNTAAFLFLNFLCTESSSSWVNGPSLMSNCLLIILLIGSGVTFGGFPSRFSKCCFHCFIHIYIYIYIYIYTPYVSFNAEIWFISKCLIVIITIFSMFLWHF